VHWMSTRRLNRLGCSESLLCPSSRRSEEIDKLRLPKSGTVWHDALVLGLTRDWQLKLPSHVVDRPRTDHASSDARAFGRCIRLPNPRHVRGAVADS
jgi:hypothetical protein